MPSILTGWQDDRSLRIYQTPFYVIRHTVPSTQITLDQREPPCALAALMQARTEQICHT